MFLESRVQRHVLSLACLGAGNQELLCPDFGCFSGEVVPYKRVNLCVLVLPLRALMLKPKRKGLAS